MDNWYFTNCILRNSDALNYLNRYSINTGFHDNQGSVKPELTEPEEVYLYQVLLTVFNILMCSMNYLKGDSVCSS